MTLECGSIQFWSLRSNKNTKAFCVVRHSIRSALRDAPRPSAASEAEIKSTLSFLRNIKCFPSNCLQFALCCACAWNQCHKKPPTNPEWSLCTQKAEEMHARGFPTDRQRPDLRDPAKLRTAYFCPRTEHKIGHSRETLWL